MKAKLLTIIDGHDVDDWRKYFIKYPGILKVCGTNKFIRRHNDYDILLLEKKRTSAVHREYYTYALYLELKSQNKQVVYREKKSIDELKYVELGDKKVSWNKELMQYEIENQFFTFDEILVM